MENDFNFDNLPMSVVYVRETVKNDNWQCDQWSVTIGQGKNAFVTDYFTGLGQRKLKSRHWPSPNCNKNTIVYKQWEKENVIPVKPDNKSIMYSLLLDADAAEVSFNDWCDNFGYSSDSISAFEVYRQCMKIAEQLAKVFSRDTMQQMREVLVDY